METLFVKNVESKPAQPSTLRANSEVAKRLPFADRRDFEEATRGFVATLPDALVSGLADRPAWSMKPYDFLKAEKAADTVNPSLWRQAQLNSIHGLFRVTERIYQVRGFDISNMTIIEGHTSLIIIDPLFTIETARASLELYLQHRPRKPVGTVIYTHSHSDHFGGVKGVINEADVIAGKVQVIAPTGFMESAVSEKILAGNAMGRRAQFQFGMLLPTGVRGLVDTGLGKASAHGTTTLIAPTMTIKNDREEHAIDGVEFVFQLALGSEAPSEMLFYLPQFRVLDMAEDVTHCMHNLYTIRGAEVRDGNLWSKYIDEARVSFGEKTDVLIAQHHWPTVGRERINDLLKKHRDMYKFIHDQSVRLLNHGYNAEEIAETLQMPASLEQEWSTRGYYGTLRHNAKAVYQKYLGWYDGNPANLDPLPPLAYAKKSVEYMGGTEAVLARAREDFKSGEFRWVASVLNQVVYANPTNSEARELAADALEQLGYQSESGIWRCAYLVGALELRHGIPNILKTRTGAGEVIKAISNDLFFDFLAVRLDGSKAEGKNLVINWTFADSNEQFIMSLENSALTHVIGNLREADVSINLTRDTLDAVLRKETTFSEAAEAGKVVIDDDSAKLEDLLSLFDNFKLMFPVVEPRQDG